MIANHQQTNSNTYFLAFVFMQYVLLQFIKINLFENSRIFNGKTSFKNSQFRHFSFVF
jgi:hypothetical protein